MGRRPGQRSGFRVKGFGPTWPPDLLLGVFPRRLRRADSPVFSLEGVAQRSSAFPMSDSSSPACRVKL